MGSGCLGGREVYVSTIVYIHMYMHMYGCMYLSTRMYVWMYPACRRGINKFKVIMYNTQTSDHTESADCTLFLPAKASITYPFYVLEISTK